MKNIPDQLYALIATVVLVACVTYLLAIGVFQASNQLVAAIYTGALVFWTYRGAGSVVTSQIASILSQIKQPTPVPAPQVSEEHTDSSAH